MRRVWQGFVRTIFWSYDRGSWPYDVMVVLIVLFVVATPRSWFGDQPQSVSLTTASPQVVSQDTSAGTQTYRVDAKLLAPEKRTLKSTPELERETHDILGRAVGDLKGHTFQVLGINPVHGDDGSVAYYDVTIRL